jgi:hypothetical protein
MTFTAIAEHAPPTCLRTWTAVFLALILTACASSPKPEPLVNVPGTPVGGPSPGKLTLPVKFLLVGDSLMIEGFGPEMEKALASHDGFSAFRKGVYSTGLNRADYFDWTAETENLIGQNKPDALIVIFGANDGQGITDNDGKDHALGTPGWSETYAKRVDAYLARISPIVKKIYWVGHPIPGNDSFFRKIKAMNSIYEAEAVRFTNVSYVNTWDRFAVNGKFSRTLRDDNGKSGAVKSGDGIHVTTFGGTIMASVVVAAVEKDIEEYGR